MAVTLPGTGTVVETVTQNSAQRQVTQAMSVPFDVAVDVTRPANTTTYTANTAWADSTSAPTTGGFTFSVANQSGGGAYISNAVITSSNPAATPLQGELWLFNGAVAAIADNASFALTDADAKLLVARIPFTLSVDAVNNSQVLVSGINAVVQAIGSVNLRGLIKVKNAYVPISAEVLTLRIQGLATN